MNDAAGAFRFGTKAQTLQRLAPRLRCSKVPPLSMFLKRQWLDAPQEVLGELARRHGGQRVAVRSSATDEDQQNGSMAGQYHSQLNVAADRPDALRAAIEAVCAALPEPAGNQFFVQNMVRAPTLAGVVTTADMASGAPYYVFNYDDESGRTDTVTGGTRINKTIYVCHEAQNDSIRSARIRTALVAVREIERVCAQPIDVEFAMDADDRFWLLQVRPISTQHLWLVDGAAVVAQRLRLAREAVRQTFDHPAPALRGSRGGFGAMPDWNPVELLGPTPRPLAMSVFAQLVSNSVWREARGLMGYYDPAGTRLLQEIAGHPYVDVRASFNSFVPADIPAAVASRLIDAWIDYLAQHPHLHDKVEFEVVQSCTDLSAQDEFALRSQHALGAAETLAVRAALLRLTRRLLDLEAGGGTLGRALGALEAQRTRQLEVLPLGATPVSARPSGLSLPAMLQRAVASSARPFAVAARHAFVAEALLRSASARGALSAERVAQFHSTLGGITTALTAAAANMRRTGASADFVRQFGHLRPGTFDICSPCYAERIDQLRSSPVAAQPTPRPAFVLTPAEVRDIAHLLAEVGLTDLSPQALLAYAQRAVLGREFGKFVLSRDVSDILAARAQWGARRGLDTEAVSYLGLDVSDAAADCDLAGVIDVARSEHAAARVVRLPTLIFDPDDVYVAPVHRARPNLFGSGRLRAEVQVINATDDWTTAMHGKAVCVDSADPGYDWVFGTGAVALITKYGGPNSHMAIRCMETGLAAAIGCGEQLYNRIVASGHVEIDFASQTVQPSHDRY